MERNAWFIRNNLSVENPGTEGLAAGNPKETTGKRKKTCLPGNLEVKKEMAAGDPVLRVVCARNIMADKMIITGRYGVGSEKIRPKICQGKEKV